MPDYTPSQIFWASCNRILQCGIRIECVVNTLKSVEDVNIRYFQINATVELLVTKLFHMLRCSHMILNLVSSEMLSSGRMRHSRVSISQTVLYTRTLNNRLQNRPTRFFRTYHTINGTLTSTIWLQNKNYTSL